MAERSLTAFSRDVLESLGSELWEHGIEEGDEVEIFDIRNATMFLQGSYAKIMGFAQLAKRIRYRYQETYILPNAVSSSFLTALFSISFI